MEWIKCSDRLPESDENVLIFSDTNDFSSPSIGYMTKWSECVTWTNLTEWVGDEGSFSNVHVSHWQPLPQPPAAPEKSA